MTLLRARYELRTLDNGTTQARLIDGPKAPFETGKKPLKGHKQWADRWDGNEGWFSLPSKEQEALREQQRIEDIARLSDKRKIVLNEYEVQDRNEAVKAMRERIEQERLQAEQKAVRQRASRTRARIL